ncbi:P-loop containing nucleoside triphosphate hydrolase protein [Coemansia reversa NRRL 1564]|uniref:ATP-dependent RNA helicase n=1 Tax=Coemansia reversa (strain ATCC 12441 / NRRL 1564) TaxID=763665 RepID=A0A2G5B8P4_COERN|nr:P-loop containing nucleoside triphosphate hydrolase protein [Coemansia reversa NRRL 1564]|eukprot:PIA15360.1 P-loop containing nucleoside triphosphate hydrolase protein [Coemansia reversa NRRL 1564]
MGLDSKLVTAMRELHGAVEANDMQKQLVKHLIRPKSHVVVRQATGTGKTFAIVASILSQAIREHQKLTEQLGYTESEAFETQALNTLYVVPNRELALQIERWASDLLAHSYPDAPFAKYVQRFVSGEGYEVKQQRVLRRHGIPAIVIGTPNSLLKLVQESPSLLVVRPPAILEMLAEASPGAEYVKRLQQVHNASKRPGKLADEPKGQLRGLRRLIIDEVDQILLLPSKNASEKKKLLRKQKPRPGQRLIDDILLKTCGLSRIRDLVNEATRKSKERTDKQENNESSRRQKNARGWRKNNDPVLGRSTETQVLPAYELDPAVTALRGLCDLVGPQSLQIVALSATCNSSLLRWMQLRGWMSSRPALLDNSEATVVMPKLTTHYCIVIEDEESVRNLRPNIPLSESADTQRTSTRKTSDNPWEVDVRNRTDQNQVAVMELMAEVAINAIEAIKPHGSVIIFTRSDASIPQFAKVLERFGIRAQDIMARFHTSSEKPANSEESGKPTYSTYIATEEAARGIDLTDASLVLILDIPKSIASYAHMAGRTGRFGQQGTVLSVVPVGKLGWYESKMRGILTTLNVQPTKAPFVVD